MSTRSLRAIIASGLLFGMSVAISPAAFADTSLSGTNPTIGSITVTDPTIAQLKQSETTVSTGGSVNIKSNAVGGFTLTVTSTKGSLKTLDDQNSINYMLGYNGGANVALTAATAATLENPGTMSATCAATDGCNRPLTVTVDGTTGKAAGTYTDTLTFNFTNK